MLRIGMLLLLTQGKYFNRGKTERISRYLENDEHFCFTYGDGVGDIDISKAIKRTKKKVN